MLKEEIRNLRYGITVALIWTAILWAIELSETLLGINLSGLGLRPKMWEGLIGIFTAPFLHGSIQGHLIGNSLSLVPLVIVLFVFYRKIAWRVILLIFVATGFWVWVVGQMHTVHIGVSGIIYGLAAFLFFSGVFRKEAVSLAISLIIVMFHGNMIWGTIPFFTPEKVSWESHLFGALAGVLAAYFYRKENLPPPKKYSWEREEANFEPETGIWDYKNLQPPPEGFDHPGKK